MINNDALKKAFIEESPSRSGSAIALIVTGVAILAISLAAAYHIHFTHSALPNWFTGSLTHLVDRIGLTYVWIIVGGTGLLGTVTIAFGIARLESRPKKPENDVEKHLFNIALVLKNPDAKFDDAFEQTLKESIEALNTINCDLEAWKIQASKFNRIIQTSGINLPLLKAGERSVVRFLHTVKENSDQLTQPVYHDGKWLYMIGQANHVLEAVCIFAETQAKRLARAVTLGTCFKYITEEEEAAAYKFDPPVSTSDKPQMHNIGHATLLFQVAGLNILTDPIFGDMNPLLYPRKTKPGLQPAELPLIDVILISHNHRDHCDVDSLKTLVFHQPLLLVPKGDEEFFRSLGFDHVHEHGWWERTTIMSGNTGVEFCSLPSRHWSGRGNGNDAQKSMTLAWSFSVDGCAYYFRGDSANIPEKTMKEIKAFIAHPIVANFEPGGPNHSRRWMASTHQSVLDSMLTHVDAARPGTQMTTYLMHHNAYELGTDRFDEAVKIKKQILDYLKSEGEARRQNWELLPDFVKKELREKEGKLNAEELERYVLSPQIGARVAL